MKKIVIILVISLLFNSLCSAKLLWSTRNEQPVVEVKVERNRINIFHYKTDSTMREQRAVFPKGSALSISHDASQKVARVYVSFDQAPEEVYYEPLTLLAKGRHQVKIRVVDQNKIESVVEFSFLVVESGY